MPTHLSAVHHILRTSAAERLAATRPTHCCLNLNKKAWTPWTNMSNTATFRSALHFVEHRQLKGWQPHVELTAARISNQSTISTLKRIFETATLWPNPLLLCICFFQQLQRRDGHDVTIECRFFFCSSLLRCSSWVKKVQGRAPYSQHSIIRNWTKLNKSKQNNSFIQAKNCSKQIK